MNRRIPKLPNSPKKNNKIPKYRLSDNNIILFFNYVLAPRNEHFTNSSIICF